MKIRLTKKIIFVAIATLLVGCGKKGVRVQPSDSVDDFTVERLFTVDSVTVYRFVDKGRRIYFTNKTGNVKAISSKYDADRKTRHTKVVETLCNGD